MKQTLMKKKRICYLYHMKVKQCDYAIASMEKKIKSLLRVRIVNKIGNKFSSCFRVKNVTEFKHHHEIIYKRRCAKICVMIITKEKRWDRSKFTYFETFCRKKVGI